MFPKWMNYKRSQGTRQRLVPGAIQPSEAFRPDRGLILRVFQKMEEICPYFGSEQWLSDRALDRAIRYRLGRPRRSTFRQRGLLAKHLGHIATVATPPSG